MRLTVTILALFLFSVIASAHPPIKVTVRGEKNHQSQAVADRIAGKIGATDRYALVSGDTGGETVALVITCLSLMKGQENNVACHGGEMFWPLPDSALYVTLDGGMASGPEDKVSDTLFDYFVEDTSDEALNAKTMSFKRRLNAVIVAHPNGVE